MEHNITIIQKNNPLKDRETKIVSGEMQQDFDELNPPPFDDEYNRQYLKEEFIEPTNLVQLPLADIPKKRGRPKKQTDGLPFYQIQYDLMDWMTGTNVVDALQRAKPFPKKYRTYYKDNRKNSREIIEVNNGLATYSSEDEVYMDLVEAIKSFEGPARQYCLPYRQISELAHAYLKQRGPHCLPSAPEIFCWMSEKDKIAWNRVIDPAPNWFDFYGSDEFREKAPIFSDFIDRCDEKLAMRQFLGSLLHPKASHKQSLHVYGERDAGKSVMFETLLECFFGKSGFAPLNTKDITKDSFIKEDFVGKMAIFADEMDDAFYSHNDYKSLTGATRQRVNIKNKSAYHTDITAKFIATSNFVPMIPSDPAVMGRMILVKIQNLKKIETDEQKFKRNLLIEVPYIIADILHAYSLLGGKRIEVSEDAHAESLEIGTAPFQVFFEQYFKHTPGTKFLPVSEFRRIVVSYGDKINYKSFRQFLTHKYGCVFDFVSPDSRRMVTNISLKSLSY